MTGRPRVLTEGIVMGESVRWHDGMAWLCDWGASALVSVDGVGQAHTVEGLGVAPWSVDWLPDGRLLMVARGEGRLVCREADGKVVTHAELADVSDKPWNELVVDSRGNAYANGIGYGMMAGEPSAPGVIAVATFDGAVRQVADGLAFPNGMAITPDGSTLVVAESHGHRLTGYTIGTDGDLGDRRVWAELGEGTPDGICADAEGAIWYADVPNRRCVRVREGGEVAQVVDVDRGCFSCALGGLERTTLYIAATIWIGAGTFTASPPTGRVLTIDVEVPGAGWP